MYDVPYTSGVGSTYYWPGMATVLDSRNHGSGSYYGARAKQSAQAKRQSSALSGFALVVDFLEFLDRSKPQFLWRCCIAGVGRVYRYDTRSDDDHVA